MSPMSTSPLLALENVSFAYPDRPPLFSSLSFVWQGHERIGLHGPNGSGKTTLLRLIMGLEKPQGGKILYRGALVDNASRLREMRRGIGFVLQNSDDQLFSITVLEDVAFGPLNLGLSRRDARDQAMETLDSLGLSHLADRPPHHLSGGEKKMVSIASVLSMRPAALLLDEPTASLDHNARNRIISLLQQQTLPHIVVSHDPDFLRQTSNTLFRVDKGDVTSVLA